MLAIPIRWGAILGIVVGATGFVFAGAGLHTNPATTAMVFVGLAIMINVAVVILWACAPPPSARAGRGSWRTRGSSALSGP
jgi:hypothetical protein